MNDKKSVEELHNYVRLALPLMSKHNVPVTPRNYAVWFEYVSGSNNELCSTIDTMLEKDEIFPEEQNEVLYRQFCAEKDENELRNLREDLQQVLVSVLSEVSELRARAKITSHFGISSSGHFWQILESKNLEIAHYYCACCFLKSAKPNLNLGAKNVKLFLREP